jgi:hypothetical protein
VTAPSLDEAELLALLYARFTERFFIPASRRPKHCSTAPGRPADPSSPFETEYSDTEKANILHTA